MEIRISVEENHDATDAPLTLSQMWHRERPSTTFGSTHGARVSLGRINDDGRMTTFHRSADVPNHPCGLDPNLHFCETPGPVYAHVRRLPRRTASRFRSAALARRAASAVSPSLRRRAADNARARRRRRSLSLSLR